MPVNMTVFIRGSVGRGGRNDDADVTAIQRQLNAQMNPPRAPLATDGLIGPKTRQMIGDFQRNVCGFRNPDFRVDPNGTTLAKLNDPASEGVWAKMSVAPPPEPATPGAGGGAGSGKEIPAIPDRLSPRQAERLTDLYKKTFSDPKAKEAKGVLDEFVQNELATLEMILRFDGITRYAVDFVRALAALRRAGLSARDIVTVFRDITPKLSGRFQTFMDLFVGIGKSERLAKTLSGLGKAATVAAVFVCVIKVVDYANKGEWGGAFAEIYGAFMGIAVPWAGVLNAIQGLIFIYKPGWEGNPKVKTAFRFLIACDPIAAGKVAVDTQYTFVTMAIKSLFTGKMDIQEMEKLVGRMRSGGMGFFVDVGESIGDWVGDKTGDWVYEYILKPGYL